MIANERLTSSSSPNSFRTREWEWKYEWLKTVMDNGEWVNGRESTAYNKDDEATPASPSFLDFVDSLLGTAGALCSGRDPAPRSSSRLRNSDQEQGVCARRWDACDLSRKIRIARRAKRYLIGVVG